MQWIGIRRASDTPAPVPQALLHTCLTQKHSPILTTAPRSDRCVCLALVSSTLLSHSFTVNVLCCIFDIQLLKNVKSARAEMYIIQISKHKLLMLFYRKRVDYWSVQCILNHFVPTWLLTSSRNQHPGQKHSELNLKNDPEPAKTIVFTASLYEQLNINCFKETHFENFNG